RHTRFSRDWSSDVCSSDLLAIFPGIAALILASIAYYFSKKTGNVNKSIQFIFLLTIIALSLSIYKTFFNKSEIEANTEELIIKRSEERRVGKECRSRWAPD